MKHTVGAWLKRIRLQYMLAGLLLAWAVGLGIATYKLQHWQRELSQVLIQLRADELLRASVRQRDQVQPEWYRRRALALLSAVERLRGDTSWTLAMPGSWRLFDDLEERAALRIDSAFSHIVVETIRRELEARAAGLSGLDRSAATGELLVGKDCVAPVPQGSGTVLAGSLDALPAYSSLAGHLDEVAQLDRAVGALITLQDAETARPEDMRMLVQYSLRAQLSGPASRSLALFNAPSALPPAQAEALLKRLQWAVWCSVSKGLGAVHAQWLDRNPVLVIEDRLAGLRPALLFEPVRAEDMARSAARLRNAAALIEQQSQALAGGSHEWMRSPQADLGPAHERLLQQIAAVRILGPEVADRLRAQGQARHAQFRRRLDASLQRAHAGIAWNAASARLMQSGDRAALGAGLARLLEYPFMSEEPATASLQPAGYRAGAAGHLDELLALVQQRRQFMRESAPGFPRDVRPLVIRYVERRVSQRAFELAGDYVETGLSSGSRLAGPVDLARAHIAQVESTLMDAGSPALASQTRERLEREILQPLEIAYPRPAPLVLMPPAWGN